MIQDKSTPTCGAGKAPGPYPLPTWWALPGAKLLKKFDQNFYLSKSFWSHLFSEGRDSVKFRRLT